MGNSKVAELDIKSILVIFITTLQPQEAEQRTVPLFTHRVKTHCTSNIIIVAIEKIIITKV